MNSTFSLFFVLFLVSGVYASELTSDLNSHSATLVFKKGDVQFLTQPREKVHPGAGQVLFNQKYYKIKEARIGRKIKLGEAIKVGPNGTAKLNFSNGDQFIVGAGTTYSLSEEAFSSQEKKSKGPLLNIFYGKMRGIVSKTGPRNNLKIQTRGAVAGVRGTDFFISAAPERVQLTVLRGKVAIEKAQGLDKEMIVESGMSAQVSGKDKTELTAKTADVTPRLVEASRQNLLDIQESSKVNVAEALKGEKIDKSVLLEIENLEKQAQKSTLEDIKIESSFMAEKIAKMKGLDVERINSEVIFDLYKKAPAEEKSKKLRKEELKYSDEEVYKNFFN